MRIQQLFVTYKNFVKVDLFNMNAKTILTQFAIFACLTSTYTFAQEFAPSVQVNMEQVPINQRDDISSTYSDVLNYLSNQRFTSKDWEGPKIPTDVTIIYASADMQSRRYSARLFFNSRRTLDGGSSSPLMKILDKEWVFYYQRGQQLSFQNLRFDGFSTMLDFYHFIALGLDADSYGDLEGTPYYQQAMDIVQLGAGRNEFGYTPTPQQPGEISKISLVTELLNPRFNEFRKLLYDYHSLGMDNLKSKPEEAKKSLLGTIKKLADFKRNQLTSQSYLMQVFLDAKRQEICDVFKSSKNKELLTALNFLDPSSASIFEDSIMK